MKTLVLAVVCCTTLPALADDSVIIDVPCNAPTAKSCQAGLLSCQAAIEATQDQIVRMVAARTQALYQGKTKTSDTTPKMIFSDGESPVCNPWLDEGVPTNLVSLYGTTERGLNWRKCDSRRARLKNELIDELNSNGYTELNDYKSNLCDYPRALPMSEPGPEPFLRRYAHPADMKWNIAHGVIKGDSSVAKSCGKWPEFGAHDARGQSICTSDAGMTFSDSGQKGKDDCEVLITAQMDKSTELSSLNNGLYAQIYWVGMAIFLKELELGKITIKHAACLQQGKDLKAVIDNGLKVLGTQVQDLCTNSATSDQQCSAGSGQEKTCHGKAIKAAVLSAVPTAAFCEIQARAADRYTKWVTEKDIVKQLRETATQDCLQPLNKECEIGKSQGSECYTQGKQKAQTTGLDGCFPVRYLGQMVIELPKKMFSPDEWKSGRDLQLAGFTTGKHSVRITGGIVEDLEKK